jgi:hypothetical protein
MTSKLQHNRSVQNPYSEFTPNPRTLSPAACHPLMETVYVNINRFQTVRATLGIIVFVFPYLRNEKKSIFEGYDEYKQVSHMMLS